MKSKHTPGPWKWDLASDGLRLVGANGLPVLTIRDGRVPIVDDKRAIETAPELLEACERLLRLHYDEGKPSAEGLETVQAAEAAIRKAKGHP